MSVAVEKLRANEAGTIGKIIADGFADDPVNLWTFNGTGAMRPMFTTMAKHLYLPHGFGHKTSNAKAGTLWLPPSVSKGFGLAPSIKMAAIMARHGGPKAIQNTLKLDSFLKRKQPKEPHYYLFAISVHPEMQGQGLGSKLMRPALDQVDTAGLPAYLESSKESNIGFYQNHGFRVIEKVVPAQGCPPLWLMWRDAQ